MFKNNSIPKIQYILKMCDGHGKYLIKMEQSGANVAISSR